MKHKTHHSQLALILFICSSLWAKEIPELLDIYTTEKDDSYMLVMEFSNSNIEYVTTETFAPPSISLLFKKVKWDRKNFTNKSSQSPLYQYGVSIPRNNNQKEIDNQLRVKLSFTRVPKYEIVQNPPRKKNRKYKLKIVWEKSKQKKAIPKYMFPSNRLPESRISLNFQGAKLMNVVRMLTSQDNLNLVVGEDLKGSVTLNLNDVSLETALDAILHVNNYEWFMQDNVIVVQPIKNPEQTMSGELVTRIFRLNYSNGQTVSAAVKEALTPRGKLKALSSSAYPDSGLGDKDILMVTDLPTNFDLIEGVIRTIDIESEQINIAVKFIETTLKHNETIGINWNLRESMNLIDNVKADSSQILNVADLIVGDQALNFATLSAPVVSAMLDLLANDGDTKLLQEPQVTTMNNSLANIVVGTRIPVLVPQGKGSVFGTNPYTYEEQNISVSLDVLPRVNRQKVISMKIDAIVESIIGYIGSEQRPMVSTRSTSTNVRVKNGETLLIGGLIFDTDNEDVSKIPFLGDLPLIKNLFNYRNTSREQRELLIFITPTVVSSSI